MNNDLVKCIHCGRIHTRLPGMANGIKPRCAQCAARISKIIDIILENLKQNKETK